MLTKDDIRANIAANFKHIRTEFEMSARQMGEKLGLNQKSYSAIEEGRSSTIHHVYKMSEYTGIKMETLISRRIDLQA